jgi:GNAT superfamily N-acetyltransferase
MIFATETLRGTIEEAAPLLERNWAESADDRDQTPLLPDWDRYAALERAGALHVTTARVDGALVGFAAFVLGNSLHSRGLRLATCDTVWLAPEHRKGRAGMRLIRAAEVALAELGVGKAVMSVKPNGVGALLRRLGYSPVEQVFVRRLGGAHG